MNKILVIEDNKTLAKLVSTKVQVELDFQIDIAYSLKEAKLFLKMYKYFVVISDLNLPDAPNGEVVDYVLSKKNKVIVLTSNINKDFKKKILQKNIIDYINKGDMSNIDYLMTVISRLKQNQNHKILVAHASIKARTELKERLENLFYKVVTVAHGEEALNLLEVTHDVSLVLTDYKMPVIDGLKLTKEIRKKYDKNSINIIAISCENDENINALFIKNGVNDYVDKDFSKEEFSCRIHNSIEALENLNLLTNQTSRDSLTGLYNRRYFIDNMDKCIEEMQESNEHYAIAIIDIDSFDSINKIYKEKTIITLADIVRTNSSYLDLVVRYDESEFYMILKNTNLYDAKNTLDKILMEVNHCLTKFSVSIGFAIHQDDTLQETLNHADMMLHQAQKAGGNRIEYD